MVGRRVSLVLLIVAAGGLEACAGWLTLKNQTNQTVVVQELYTAAGQKRRGKAIQLHAGETLRQFVPGPVVKQIEIYDAGNPSQPLWNGSLSCVRANQSYAIVSKGGKLAVEEELPPGRK